MEVEVSQTDWVRRLFDTLSIEFGERLMRRFSKVPIICSIRSYRNLWPLLKDHLTLELGSERGFGSIGIKNCIRTDLRPINGVDVVCDATQLPFRDQVFDRTWCVYLAHHVPNLKKLITEAKRVASKFYLFDFIPKTFLHYFSVIWDWLFFRDSIVAADPNLLKSIAPNLRMYRQSSLGSVLYAF